jgi:hypothetical protein
MGCDIMQSGAEFPTLGAVAHQRAVKLFWVPPENGELLLT